MDSRLTSKENGSDLIPEEPVKSCCHQETNGVENVAFEGVIVAHSASHHGHDHKEEIGLEGMNYKPLCSCDESGTPCKCGAIKEVHMSRRGMQELRTQPWGKWKCVAFSLVVALTCVWVVVFVPLLVKGII